MVLLSHSIQIIFLPSPGCGSWYPLVPSYVYDLIIRAYDSVGGQVPLIRRFGEIAPSVSPSPSSSPTLVASVYLLREPAVQTGLALSNRLRCKDSGQLS